MIGSSLHLDNWDFMFLFYEKLGAKSCRWQKCEVALVHLKETASVSTVVNQSHLISSDKRVTVRCETVHL